MKKLRLSRCNRRLFWREPELLAGRHGGEEIPGNKVDKIA
jgi:hypothetical protein